MLLQVDEVAAEVAYHVYLQQYLHLLHAKGDFINTDRSYAKLDERERLLYACLNPQSKATAH